jgi:hypothetical protein
MHFSSLLFVLEATHVAFSHTRHFTYSNDTNIHKALHMFGLDVTLESKSIAVRYAIVGMRCVIIWAPSARTFIFLKKLATQFNLRWRVSKNY